MSLHEDLAAACESVGIKSKRLPMRIGDMEWVPIHPRILLEKLEAWLWSRSETSLIYSREIIIALGWFDDRFIEMRVRDLLTMPTEKRVQAAIAVVEKLKGDGHGEET